MPKIATVAAFILLFTVTSGLAPCLAASPPAPVPQTGQTISSNPGDDGNLRKGVPWPIPRFIDNGNGTVTDRLTGLIWMKNANCASYDLDGTGELAWTSALNWANNFSNAGQLNGCGLTDGSNAGQWRMPTIRELKSLLDLSRFGPALPAGHPFTNVQAGFYWTSTTSDRSTTDAWYVDMNNGDLNNVRKINQFFVWPVRNVAP